ncbi:MAG: tetratricopeptide repeat protein [Candidatus Eremiobacteraeota bacterium]|nr:tetratricopeptide repeat protein [Candidatus Eremiobacteraeota bacterium]
MAGLFTELATEFALFRAASALKKEEHARAKLILSEALEKNPDHEGLLATLGSLALIENDCTGARDFYSRAVKAGPRNPSHHLFLGITDLMEHRYDSASLLFAQCREMSPENLLARNYLSLCALLAGDCGKAIADLKRDGLYSSSLCGAWLMYALENALIGFEQPGKDPGALSPPAEAADGSSAPPTSQPENISSEPSQAPAGPEEKKSTLLEGLVNAFPAALYWFIAQYHLSREHFPKALPLFRKILVLSPGTQRIHFHIGECLFYEEHFDEAFPHFEKSQACDGENPEVLYYLGKIYQKRGEWDNARDHLARSLALFPKSPEILYSLGEIALRRGFRDEAIGFFKKAAEYDFSYLREKLQKLEEKCRKG